MLLDKNTILSDKQAITANAYSQNTIDCGAAGNVAPGSLFAVCRTEEGFSGLTQMEVTLQTDEEASFANPAELMSVTVSAEVLEQPGKILFAVPLPVGVKRYLRASYVPAGSATQGAVSFFLTDGVDMK